MSTYLRPMSEEVRERIRLPQAPVPQHGPARVAHVHLWVENGWAGTLSPAVAVSPEAISRAVRELAEELGTTMEVSHYFPAAQVFMPIRERATGKESRLNVTWKPCPPTCPNQTADWL